MSGRSAKMVDPFRKPGIVAFDPDIMGNSPVFQETRVPVHRVAATLEHGQTDAALRHADPRPPAAVIRLAPIGAAAYPLRGSRRSQAWQEHPPIRSTRRTLAATALE